jgi:hypothetical protein
MMLVNGLRQIVEIPRAMFDDIKIRIHNTPAYNCLEWAGTFPIKTNSIEEVHKFNLPNEKGNHYLRIKVSPYNTTTIQGSIRKWYLGSQSLKDLDYFSFLGAINLIAERLGFQYEDLLWAHVSSFEFGANIKIPKKYYLPILQSIADYPRLEWNFYPQSKYFKGNSFDLKFYDKLTQMIRREKSKLAKLIIDKVDWKILRFEIDYKKVSKLGYRLGRTRTVGDLLNNWNLIIDDWTNSIENIRFNESLELSEMDFSSMTVKDHRDFLELVGLSQVGYSNTLNQISNLQASSSHKSQYRKSFEKKWKKFMEMNELNYPEWILKGEIQEIAEKKKIGKN